MSNDQSKSSIGSDFHHATFDVNKINHAIERVAAGDDRFVSEVLQILQDVDFPAFKHEILDHTKLKTADPDIVGLIESIDGYIEFKDLYHVQKAIKENGEKYKLEHQISDETRKNPNFNIRPNIPGQGIKEKEVAGKEEERKDYPEIPPTMRRNYVCNFCGTSFLTPDDLVHHQRFEGSENMERKEGTTTRVSAKRVGDITGEPPETRAVNRDMAANLLEDLKFPATKNDVQDHLSKKNAEIPREIEEKVKRLKENVIFNSVYEIELDSGLVKKTRRRTTNRKGVRHKA